MSIRLLLNQSATVEAYQGTGAYGPVYGEPVEVGCRVDWSREMVRDSDGNEVVASARLYILPDDQFPTGSRVTVDGYTTSAVTVAPRRGRHEVNHVEVTLL